MSRPVTYIFLLLCVGHLVEGRAEDQQVAQLRTQLEAARAAEDKPAIIELSRRILAITPNDPQLWQMTMLMLTVLAAGVPLYYFSSRFLAKRVRPLDVEPVCPAPTPQESSSLLG